MRFELKLLKRYLFSRRRGLAGFTALAAVAGIALGVGGLILAQALGNGFQTQVRDKLLANFPHITIFKSAGGEIADAQSLMENIKALENVSGVVRTASVSAVLTAENSNEYALLQTAETDPPGVVIGVELAAASQLAPGDVAELITFVVGGDPIKTKVRIASTVSSGMFEHDRTRINVSPKEFAAMTGSDIFRPTMIAVNVNDIYTSDRTAAAIREQLGDEFRVVDWQEANRPLFAALNVEKRAALFVLSLIVLIAGLNISTTLALLVNERRRDLAVLRTAGARSRSLLLIFLIEGAMIGFVGILLGLAFGIGGSYLANYFKLVSLDPQVYLLEGITLLPQFGDVLMIGIGAFLLSLIASAYPAVRAMRLKPLENLRIG